MRLLVEVEIPDGIEAREVLEELTFSMDTDVFGATTLRVDNGGTISNSRTGIYGTWKVVRP